MKKKKKPQSCGLGPLTADLPCLERVGDGAQTYLSDPALGEEST